MANEHVNINYNDELKPLEVVLAEVKRAGDFVVHGRLELPMPKVEIDGVGVLSFPVPDAQIAALIQQAVRAPFGRGEETILDTSVRKVWQLPPDRVRLGGKSWATSFETMLAKVATGLGCDRAAVSAELYKLLIYDEGGFFAAHRDTEKAGGMFGTLVVVLPSAHRGGELVVRHAGREVSVDLSGGEVSEVAFAAFYADCEHEVLPVAAGNRVCLVYSLIQAHVAKRGAAARLTAPDYEPQVAQAAELLGTALARDGATAKIVWLLAHHYSPAGLAFSALKSADAAKAQVLLAAAARANCAVHLGIVHIEESGAAEPTYDPYSRRRGRRYYNEHAEHEDEEDVQEDAGDDDFEVVDISDSWRYVDQWIDPQDRAVAFGKLPLADGELLPQGALDDEKPDSQRLTEATGNEGASFERSYHRAAVVIWHRERYAEVLLQAGVGAALPWLKERVKACAGASGQATSRREAAALARRMIERWTNEGDYRLYRGMGQPADRAEMLGLLGELGDAGLLEEFVAIVVTEGYDGSENAALVAHLPLLASAKMGELAAAVIRQRMRHFPGGCVALLQGLIGDGTAAKPAGHSEALRRAAEATVAALDEIKAPTPTPQGGRWPAQHVAAILAKEAAGEVADNEPDDHDDFGASGRNGPVDAAFLANLLNALGKSDTPEAAALREAAARKIAARPAVFDPVTVVVPALKLLRAAQPKGGSARPDGAVADLWAQSAGFLLRRSEFPPEPPKDWRQDVTIPCRCADCCELQAFVLNPAEQVHRFRVRQDRRQHLHGMIEQHGLEMTHVTERKGSPQTLVCTKDRRGYRLRCEQYCQDIAALAALAGMAEAGDADQASRLQRIEAARARHGSWVPD